MELTVIDFDYTPYQKSSLEGGKFVSYSGLIPFTRDRDRSTVLIPFKGLIYGSFAYGRYLGNV